jgi:copper(I)-binding protein
MRRRYLLTAAVLAPITARAQSAPSAASAQGAPITIDHVWSRAAMAGRVGVVYLTIIASGSPDALTGVSSPIAPKAELHESYNDNGVEKMRPVASLPVTPGTPVMLKPGGYHIMLVGLMRALNAGDSFPVTLRFAKAGAITVTAMVEKAGASSMPGMKM